MAAPLGTPFDVVNAEPLVETWMPENPEPWAQRRVSPSADLNARRNVSIDPLWSSSQICGVESKGDELTWRSSRTQR